MPYWDVVMRSFRISWNHKYLWLIALFSGEGGGGFSFNYSQPSTGRGASPNFATIQQQVTTWVADHVALIVLLAILWLLLVIVFFILAAVCEGATVRASAEHDAERQFGLRWAWRSGVTTMWVIVRFRLLLLALVLPVFLVAVGLGTGIAVSLANGNSGAVAGLVVLGLGLALLAIPYLIYLSLLDRLGSRAAVLEQIPARPAIVRAHRLLRKRLGRALLVWLLSIAVGIVLAIALACLLAIVFVPLFLIGAVAFASGTAAFLPFVILGVVILLPVALVVQGFVAAQSSTYWTLAFRRLDLEQAPAYSYPYQPTPQPPQITS